MKLYEWNNNLARYEFGLSWVSNATNHIGLAIKMNYDWLTPGEFDDLREMMDLYEQNGTIAPPEPEPEVPSVPKIIRFYISRDDAADEIAYGARRPDETIQIITCPARYRTHNDSHNCILAFAEHAEKEDGAVVTWEYADE